MAIYVKPDYEESREYFIAFTHKVFFPAGKIEFQNCVIQLEAGEKFDVRALEKQIQSTSNVNDVTIINFIKL